MTPTPRGDGDGEGDGNHPVFARAFERAAVLMDRRGAAEHRRRLLARARGEVLELGSGTGANFGQYPDGVTRVHAIEPDEHLFASSTRAARNASIPITVERTIAESLPFPDASMDTVVASLVLCSVTDPRQALRECRRVLRQDGLLLFYEHVRAENAVLARVEDALTPLWSSVAGGCHPNRATQGTIEEAGFRIIDADRFGFSPLPLAPPVAHILGAARPI